MHLVSIPIRGARRPIAILGDHAVYADWDSTGVFRFRRSRLNVHVGCAVIRHRSPRHGSIPSEDAHPRDLPSLTPEDPEDSRARFTPVRPAAAVVGSTG